MIKPLIIITGASSGIGAATAKIFSAAGYPLGLIARNKTAMEQLHLPEALYLQADVTDSAALYDAIQTAEKKYGPVDCLINNAGITYPGDFTELLPGQNEEIIKINVQGVINGIEIVLPGMRVRKTGTIINISSLADRNARPQQATYAASKAAIKSLTESLRMANAPYGIRFCNLAPARIATPMTQIVNPHITTMPAEHFAEIIFWVYQQPQTICIRDMVIAPTAYEL